ncbi:MAG TPA: SRPBCC domain-containing protein [Gemmatimonadaceae bacterium]
MTHPSEAPVTRNPTIYSTPSDRELVITRTFDAPRRLVWAAFTDPKHLPKWQPSGATMPVCEIDLRAGGTWHYVYRNPQGREIGVTGTYREVDPPKRMVQVTNNHGEENTTTTTFAEDNGRTTVTVSMLFASQASREQGLRYAKFGTEGSYTRLDAYLASEMPTNQTENME